MPIIHLNNEQGLCPYCGNDELNWGDFELESGGGHYEVGCNKCGKHFHECYGMPFEGKWGEKKDV